VVGVFAAFTFQPYLSVVDEEWFSGYCHLELVREAFGEKACFDITAWSVEVCREVV
jgi:hypothetical protein